MKQGQRHTGQRLGKGRSEQEDLTRMAKGAMEKQVLAWMLRKQTVVSRRWISRRLHMGDESRVTHAVSAVGGTKDRRILRLRNRLLRS